MFGRRVLTIAALQGLSVLLVAFAVYLWGVLDNRPDNVVRSVTFATIVFGNLALILVNRSWRLSIWQSLRQRRNPTLKWILVVAPALLILLFVVPPMRRAFNFGPIDPIDWLIAIIAGFAGVAWFEIYKTKARPAEPERVIPPANDAATPLPL